MLGLALPKEYELIIGSIAIATCWSISSILQKDVFSEVNPNTLLFYVAMMFCGMMIVLAILRPDIVDVRLSMDYYRYVQMALIALLGFFVPNFLLFNLIGENDVNRVIALSYISPMITVLLAWLLLNERINVYSVVGVILISTGAYLIATHTTNSGATI